MSHRSPSVTGSRHVTVHTDDGVRSSGVVVPARVAGRGVAVPAAAGRLLAGAAGVAVGGAGRIAPTPLLVVHGDRGTCSASEHPRALVRAAGPTTTSWVVRGAGHAGSGATAPLVERIGRRVSATIDV